MQKFMNTFLNISLQIVHKDYSYMEIERIAVDIFRIHIDNDGYICLRFYKVLFPVCFFILIYLCTANIKQCNPLKT
jgi:hypothetical protein